MRAEAGKEVAQLWFMRLLWSSGNTLYLSKRKTLRPASLRRRLSACEWRMFD
jgi:hypothetical protein